MTEQRSFIVRVPATSANLGPGFDVLGLALGMYNTARVQAVGAGESTDAPAAAAAGAVIESIEGQGAGALPQGDTSDDNLFVRSMRSYAAFAGKELPPCRLRLINEIPLARGLGSSAAAIVGGLAAGAALVGHSPSDDELLDLAATVEGHPDNVAAAIHGGLTIAFSEDGKFRAAKLMPAPSLTTLLLVPDTELSTEEARAALPAQVSREDAVFNLARVSLLVAGLISGDHDLVARGVQDRLHQPARMALLPHFEKVRTVCAEAGASGLVLSGAGPTMLAFIESLRAAEALSRLTQALDASALPIRVKECKIVTHGVEVEY